MSDNTRTGKFVSMQTERSGKTGKGQSYSIYSLTLQFKNKSEFSPTFPSWTKEVVEKVRKLQPGQEIKITLDAKNNVSDVEVLGAAPASADTPAPSQPKTSSAGTSKPAAGQFRDPAEIIRGEALGIAVRHYANIMENSERMSKLVKKTETLENLELGLFGFAAKAEQFILGKLTVALPQSMTDAIGAPANLDQPDVPDDVPADPY